MDPVVFWFWSDPPLPVVCSDIRRQPQQRDTIQPTSCELVSQGLKIQISRARKTSMKMGKLYFAVKSGIFVEFAGLDLKILGFPNSLGESVPLTVEVKRDCTGSVLTAVVKTEFFHSGCSMMHMLVGNMEAKCLAQWLRES